MSRYIVSIALIVGVLLVMFPHSSNGQDGEDVTDQNDVDSVIIALTRLDVNDTNLELSYKIKNKTDHDVWICDSVSIYTKRDFEVYLSEDEQSLLIRRRLDVPTASWVQGRTTGRYVLLHPEQERTESVSLAVPVEPYRVFATELATSLYARRLVLEIAEKLNCLGYSEYKTDLFMRYFKGIWISQQLFGGLSGFEENTYKIRFLFFALDKP